jgi:hypothetical protein
MLKVQRSIVLIAACLVSVGFVGCAYHPGAADSKQGELPADKPPTPIQTGVATGDPQKGVETSDPAKPGGPSGQSGSDQQARPVVSPGAGTAPAPTDPSVPGASPAPVETVTPVPTIPRAVVHIQVRNRPAIELQVAKIGLAYQPVGPIQLPAFAPDRITLIGEFESKELGGSAATRVIARFKAHDLANRCELQSKITSSGWDESKARYLAAIEISGLACVTRLTSEFTLITQIIGSVVQTPAINAWASAVATSNSEASKQIEIELPFRRDMNPGPLSVQWVSGTGSGVAQELSYDPELRYFRGLRVLTLPEVSQDQATLRWVLPTEIATPLLTHSSGVGLELDVESVRYTQLRLEAFRSKSREAGDVTEVEMDLTGLAGLLPSSRDRLGSLKLQLGEALVEVPLIIQGLKISEIRWQATIESHDGQPERAWQETRVPKIAGASEPLAEREAMPTSDSRLGDTHSNSLECDPVTLPALPPRTATLRLMLGAYAKFLKGFAVDLELTKLSTGAHRSLSVSKNWMVPIGSENQVSSYELWVEFHGLSEYFSPTQSEEAQLTVRLRDTSRTIVEVMTLFRTPPDAQTLGLEWVDFVTFSEAERDELSGDIQTIFNSERRSAGLYKILRFKNHGRFETHLTIPSRWSGEAQVLVEKGAPVSRNLNSYFRRWRWHLSQNVDVFTAMPDDNADSEFASWLVAPVFHRELILNPQLPGSETGGKAWLGIFASAPSDKMDVDAMPPTFWPMESLEGMQRFAPRSYDPVVTPQGIVDIDLTLLTERLEGELSRVTSTLGIDHEYTLTIEDCLACVKRDFITCTSCYAGVYRDPAEWGEGVAMPKAWLSERNFRSVSVEAQKLGSWQIYRDLNLDLAGFPGVMARWKKGEEGRAVR